MMKELSEAFAAHVIALTNRPCGVVDIPNDAEKPYFVLYPIASGGPEGSMADENDMRNFLFQLTSVGEGWEQCSYWADRIASSPAALRSALSGAKAIFVGIDQYGSVTREDAVTYNRADTYSLKVSTR